MSEYQVKLHPSLVNPGTEGSLDTAIVDGKTIQRTVNGLLIKNGNKRKMIGQLTDGSSFNTTVPGNCGIPGIVCELGTGWGLLFNNDDETSSTFFPQSADVDSEGNIFYLSINSDSPYDSTSVVRKISPTGEILWQKNLACGEGNSDFDGKEGVRIRTSSDDGAFVIYRRTVRKIDADGNEVWAFIQDSGYSSLEYFVGCAEDSSGNLFVSGYGYNEGDQFVVIKFDNTGAILAERFINASHIEYMAADMVVDSNDDVIIPMNVDLNDGAWSTNVAKFPNDLSGSTPIWFTTLSAEYGYPNDQDCLALGKDDLDNIYVFGYYNSVTKLNSSGEIVWARDIDGEGMGVDADGNCYIVDDNNDAIQIIKITSDGNLDWAYQIANLEWDDLFLGGYFNDANSVVQVKNGVLVAMSRAETAAGYLEFIIRVELEPLSGTFGDFEITDITSEIEFNTLSPTDNSANSTVEIYEADVVSNVTETFDDPSITQDSALFSFE